MFPVFVLPVYPVYTALTPTFFHEERELNPFPLDRGRLGLS